MKCGQCQAEMAKVQSSVALVHGEHKKKYTSISLWGDIDTYVCPECGFMGFVASNYRALKEGKENAQHTNK